MGLTKQSHQHRELCGSISEHGHVHMHSSVILLGSDLAETNNLTLYGVVWKDTCRPALGDCYVVREPTHQACCQLVVNLR